MMQAGGLSDVISHLVFFDLIDGGDPWTARVTRKRNTWRRLAVSHAQDLCDAGVRPGAYGIGAPWHRITARFADGREKDVTVTFVADGWHQWRESDEYFTYPENVPANQPARRRRAAAYWAYPDCVGANPLAERELDEARAAELDEMAEAAASTAPGGKMPFPADGAGLPQQTVGRKTLC